MEKSKYNSLVEWSKGDRKGYDYAKRQNMLEEICNIFGWEFRKMSKKNSEFNILLNLGLDFEEYVEFKSKMIK